MTPGQEDGVCDGLMMMRSELTSPSSSEDVLLEDNLPFVRIKISPDEEEEELSAVRTSM